MYTTESKEWMQIKVVKMSNWIKSKKENKSKAIME